MTLSLTKFGRFEVIAVIDIRAAQLFVAQSCHICFEKKKLKDL